MSVSEVDSGWRMWYSADRNTGVAHKLPEHPVGTVPAKRLAGVVVAPLVWAHLALAERQELKSGVYLYRASSEHPATACSLMVDAPQHSGAKDVEAAETREQRQLERCLSVAQMRRSVWSGSQ